MTKNEELITKRRQQFKKNAEVYKYMTNSHTDKIVNVASKKGFKYVIAQ